MSENGSDIASSVLRGLASARAEGMATGLTSVCSAHPLVLEAALRHAVACDAPVLIEATCNQVNQDGGYTGLTPLAFRRQLDAMAISCRLPPDRLMLGGDHLGPNPWTGLPAHDAMARAETMVADYVAAGFSKLHLDTSMPCADDPATLSETVVASRAARLAQVGDAAARRDGRPLPLYVVGTEVPPPGGARERIDSLHPTDPGAAECTLAAHEQAFAAAGAADAMERVIALVVQPGVEFGTENVVAYQPAASRPLVDMLARHGDLVFEAHSTDYQSASALAALVRDGFALLKVGPALTLALREALYRLDALAGELAPTAGEPTLRDVMDRAMLADPRHWQGHYHGDEAMQRRMRHYSYSDRIRYYWQTPDARAAVTRLVQRLEIIPETLLSQFLPEFRNRVRDGLLPANARALLLASIDDVLSVYTAAGSSRMSAWSE